MRPRKNLLPLSTDSVLAAMLPGKSYTTATLACIVDGSPAAIRDVLATIEATGRIRSAAGECGRYKDSRESRRLYWIDPYASPHFASRRMRPVEVKGQLTGYDLLSVARLAMTARR